MHTTLAGLPALAGALLMTALAGAAQANYSENFDGTSLNTAFTPGQTITGSDFYVLQGLAFDQAKGSSTDRFVLLNINSTYGQGPTATMKSTTLFNLEAGTQYTLSFDFSPTSGAPGNGPFNWNLTASIAGYTTTVDGYSAFGAPYDWQTVNLVFVPLADVNLVPIIFAVGSSLTDYVNAPIDNVRLTAAPIPEPEAWAMLLAGLGLVGLAARRRRA